MTTDIELQSMFVSEPLANFNGKLMPLSQVKVSVLDRGFLFGDAVYEVIRVYYGKPFLYEEHVERLKKNLEKVSIRVDVEDIRRCITETLATARYDDALVYVQVTRGAAPRTHRFPHPNVVPNVLIYVSKFEDPYAQERKQGAAVIVTNDLRWKRCDIKSVNLLANCLAAEAAHAAGCTEALLVDDTGQIIEGSRSSLFGVKDGCVLTAPLGENILPGITRRLLMKLSADCSIPMTEAAIYQDQLSDIDELFLTSTTMDILPVTKVDRVVIGNGAIGPVVKQLKSAFEEAVRAFVSG